MMIDCEYPCEFHRTNKGTAEWHHPISTHPEVGIFLCEAHHSLLMGRKHRYTGETIINKTLSEMKEAIMALIVARVIKAGFLPSDIDKN